MSVCPDTHTDDRHINLLTLQRDPLYLLRRCAADIKWTCHTRHSAAQTRLSSKNYQYYSNQLISSNPRYWVMSLHCFTYVNMTVKDESAFFTPLLYVYIYTEFFIVKKNLTSFKNILFLPPPPPPSPPPRTLARAQTHFKDVSKCRSISILTLRMGKPWERRRAVCLTGPFAGSGDRWHVLSTRSVPALALVEVPVEAVLSLAIMALVGMTPHRKQSILTPRPVVHNKTAT